MWSPDSAGPAFAKLESGAEVLRSHLLAIGVTSIDLCVVEMPPVVEQRLVHDALSANAALVRITKPAGASFAEAFLLRALDTGKFHEAAAIAQFHQPLSNAGSTWRIETSLLSDGYIESLRGGQREMVVLTSLCQTSSGQRHLPMLDFKIPSTARNDLRMRDLDRVLGHGIVLTSGSSYHFYGSELLTTDGLREFLLHAQLLSGIVDTRWVTHQLIENKCALRVSRNARQQPPRLLTQI